MDLPLYMSYWVGMDAKACGVESRDLTAKEELTSHEISSLVLQARRLDTVWESCYYKINADSADLWRDDSQLYIYLEASSTANMYVYSGTDRRNTTLIVEGNSNVPVGAPIRIPITDGAVVVLQVQGALSPAGSATFSYKVVGTKYNWYEELFLG